MTEKQKAALAVKKAQGTLTKVMDMIEKDAYCPEIIQQIAAAEGLLRSSKKVLLAGHLDHCLVDRMKTNKPQTTEELLKIFDLQ